MECRRRRVRPVGHRAGQALDDPSGWSDAAPRTRSAAQKTASGVAGEASSTLAPAGPNAATASRRASRTANASISGGSPTAFEP